MRGAVHRILPALGGLLLVGWGASYLTRPTPAADTAMHGRLATFDASLAAAWEPIATLDGDALEGGRILALDARNDTLVLAHPHAVSVLVNGRLVHRFGSDVVGAPEFIARGAGIALTDHGIAVLDPPQHRVDFWRPDGARIARVALPSSSQGAQYAAVASLDHAVLVTAFLHSDAGPGWWVWRVTPTATDTVLARHAAGEAGAAFRIPMVGALRDTLWLLDALRGTMFTLGPDGKRLDSTARPDHPRSRVPERSRRRLREMSATMPQALRRALDVGDYGPSTRALSATEDGRLLVLTADLDEAMHVELLDRAARPMGRLWEAAESAQLFLVRGRVYRLREDDARYVIDRMTPRPSQPVESTPP